jgi:hypothetical protein
MPCPALPCQVVAGLLRVPDEEMHRHRHRDDPPAAQQAAARDFLAMWAPYDWTLQL